MSRMTARLATIALLTLAASPALAEARTPTDQAASSLRQPASAEVRATYDRMDALSRSVFWASEQEAVPNDPVAGVRLAQALRELGRYDQAVEAAETTLAIQPTNLDAMLELGRAHIARGRPSTASVRWSGRATRRRATGAPIPCWARPMSRCVGLTRPAPPGTRP